MQIVELLWDDARIVTDSQERAARAQRRGIAEAGRGGGRVGYSGMMFLVLLKMSREPRSKGKRAHRRGGQAGGGAELGSSGGGQLGSRGREEAAVEGEERQVGGKKLRSKGRPHLHTQGNALTKLQKYALPMAISWSAPLRSTLQLKNKPLVTAIVIL